MDNTVYKNILAGLNKAAAFNTYLETHDDPEVLQTKTEHDQNLFAYVKEAAGAKEILGKVLKHPITRGAGYGLGAAIPAAAAGSWLVGRAGEESRKSIEDARNKALQAALGVGGVGAGLLALHRLTSPMNKTSSDKQALLEKLATVGFLDSLLGSQENNKDEMIKQSAHECRMLNAEHCVHLLQQLLT